MKNTPLKRVALALIAVLATVSVHAESTPQNRLTNDQLAGAFANPPPESRPGCYWYWMNNEVSREGITKDLEAMAKAGIGRAYIGIITFQAPTNSNSLPALSEPWWENVRHAIREAGRVGVDIGFFNSPGWSMSGGPWVKPEQSMRYASCSEIRLKGLQKFSGPLPKPQGMIQEIAVLAYPVPQFEDQKIPEKERTTNAVTFESDTPVTVRSLTIQILKKSWGKVNLEISDDGKTYRKITSFMVNRGKPDPNVGPIILAPVVVSIPPTTGKYFRLTFVEVPKGRRVQRVSPDEWGEIRLSSALRNGSVYEKQLAKLNEDGLPGFDYYMWPAQSASAEAGQAIPEKEILNLSSHLKPDGTLEWEVPPGEWIVQRVGMAPTETKNFPAPPEATGPEVDKLTRDSLNHHFDTYIGKLLASMPEKDRKAFKYVVADSYEKGSQNWTDGFAEIFRKRYGYNPTPWLATLTGRVVENQEKSDRFLWDLRRLVADRIATEYVGGLRDISHAHGLSIWLENYGTWGFPAEFLQYGGQSDEVAGEFWVDQHIGRMEIRCASSAVHIYEKKRVWCESYTGGPLFLNTPRELKKVGDWSFSEGVNQAILHLFIHQSVEKRGPGNMAGFGTEFNHHNTWWNLAMKPWVDYQRKCTVMLQAGNPVADVAYFIGEDTPKMAGIRDPALPPGYDYDYINADVIQNRLSVKDGRLVLPEGTSYRLLVLPPVETMRPEVLRKIKELVEAGATVVGPAPKRSPSMENYPQCDQEIESLVKELWGSGKIRPVKDLKPLLPCGPDVVAPADVLVWKHRTDGNREIYFISNQTEQVRDDTISFRVKGKEPELWWPETGKVEPASAFKLQGERTEVPLHLEPLTSVFVVFEKPAKQDRVAAQTAKPSVMQEINGPWEVQFDEKKVTFEKLVPWPENTDPDVKYFSGEAVYRKEFEVPDVKPGTVLDLGDVNAVAKVVLNGKDLGVLWKPPCRVDVDGALKAGKNTLEVTVVQTWNNRIIGDAQPGAKPTIFFNRKVIRKATNDLQPSGLLGPVKLIEKTNSR